MKQKEYEKKLWDTAMLQNIIQEHVDTFLEDQIDVVWWSAAIGVLEYQKQSLVSQLAKRMSPDNEVDPQK